MAKSISISKRYSGKQYLYWWDVWDQRKEAIAEAGELVLVQRDTRRKARIPAVDLLRHLTESRRTTRGQCRGSRGNWGLYVRPGRPDEIEIEGGRSPAVVPVRWE